MFNQESKNILAKPQVKQNLLIGIILILIAAFISLIILLNFYFTEKLSQIQNLAIQNSQRETAIENFLNTMEGQLKAQAQANMAKDLSGKK